jgi:2',3'-cyclic-nucleotide 2'-phosphodiesterase/3'-nucleotidase
MSYRLCIVLPLLASAAVHASAAPRAPAPPRGSTATLAVLETTDLHANVLGYDYYKLAADPSLGLDRTATLIAQARREFANTLLLDDGDTIQGTALGDYQAQAAPLACDKTLAIYKVMNYLRYDGATVGNHDFNYGLPFLSQVTGSRLDVAGVDAARPRCAGPAFPQVLANIISVKSHQPLFAPYRIIDKQVAAFDAKGRAIRATLKIGIIGFTPPTILSWDKRALEGKVVAEGIRETAQKYIPEMRAKGADLIVAISHGGLDDSAYSPSMENANWHLAQVPGIDAMLIGHSHQVFPNAASTVAQFQLPGVDKARGLVHGVPTTMANQWGKQLGVIGLHMAFDGKRWRVDHAQTTVEARGTQLADKSYVAPDPAIAALVADEHAATIAYVKSAVGSTAFRMASYFADVGDVSALAVVNLAQTDYVRRYVDANLPQYAALPVLSMASPFKSGTAGVRDYTDVAAGPLAINNAADLYLYPNLLTAVKIDGAGLQAWLEKAAGRFNTIDPTRTDAQELVNPAHPSYNFDVPTSADISYQIDITQAPGKRVKQLAYRGKPVAADDQFLVATNNYRASGGGGFAGLDGSKTVLAAPDGNRDVLIAYVKLARTLTREAHSGHRSWRFAPVATSGPVVFHAPPGLLAVAQQAGVDNVVQLRADDGLGKGFALYGVDLAK